MSTKVKVIITENFIYATYLKTICFKMYYLNENEKDFEIFNAKSTAFNYACTLGAVNASIETNFFIKNDNDLFDYLEKNN